MNQPVPPPRASADAFVRALAQRLQGRALGLWDDLREAPPDPEALLRAAADVLGAAADEATERTTDEYDYAAQFDGDRLRIWFGRVPAGAARRGAGDALPDPRPLLP